MKSGEKVRIIYGKDALHGMHGFRAVFEYFGQDTSVVLVDTEDKLRAAFADATPYSVTLMLCHGWGKTEEDAVICWTLHRPVNEIEWENYELHWTASNVRDYVTCGSGVLVNTACWSGKQMWADVFLESGFGSYVAPEKTSDMFSAYQFIAALIGYLVYEGRDYGARLVTIQEAVELARKLDDFWDGANGFRLFGG